MLSPGVEIIRCDLEIGMHDLPIDAEKVHSIYVYEGQLTIEEQKLEANDFCIVSKSEGLVIENAAPSSIFMISSPGQLNYLTYAQIQQNA